MDFLNFDNDNSLTGFRLKTFELLNWGTFNTITKIEPDSANSLLTGNVGSGKSTVVDAITTLLVPHNKIIYNRAAGAEWKERTIYSYVRGEYRTEKTGREQSAKAVYLRDDTHYSVILGHFYNSGYLETATLAQVFYIRGGSIEKFFVVSRNKLSIKEHFTGFGSDIKDLKKKLKNIEELELFETFANYSSKFRSVFGIKSEKALELFFHTVSLKSIGNLTDFVRDNMLEKQDAATEIGELIKNFDHLTRAHEAVIKAKEQIKLLEPLVTFITDYDTIEDKYNRFVKYSQAMPVYFAENKLVLIQNENERLTRALHIHNNNFQELNTQINMLQDEKISLIKTQQSSSEAIRLNEIEYLLKKTNDSRAEKLLKYTRYSGLCKTLSFHPKADADIFYENISRLKELTANLPEKQNKIENDKVVLTIASSKLKTEIDLEKNELESLRSRASQIPFENIKLRNSICDVLKINPEEIPFTAELIRIKSGCEKWEGACERILHNFGLSILVHDKYYKKVNEYINKTDLKMRIVYYKVKTDNKTGYREAAEKNAIITKLDIKSDTVYYDWLYNEIVSRFNVICCDTMEDFYHLPYAVTPEGLTKTGGVKHEKDDRKSIFDRRYYILGWDNKRKIRLLEERIAELEKEQSDTIREIAGLKKSLDELNTMILTSRELAGFTDFNSINWEADVKEITKLEDEKKKLESGSELLKSITERLLLIAKELITFENEKNTLVGEISNMDRDLKHYRDEELVLTNMLSAMPLDIYNEIRKETEAFFEGIIKNRKLTISTFQNIENEIREKVFNDRDKLQKEAGLTASKITRLMSDFNNKYPDDTLTLSADISFRKDYTGIFTTISQDQLPKFEGKFRDLLKEKTIQGIALFKQKLESFGADITEKIDNINKSLNEIEYNPGTFIILEAEETQDIDIRNFRYDLRRCLENTAGESDLYSEGKFLDVKQILDKFKDEKSFNWMNKVTDVRNWYRFNARERWISDSSEKEFYSDSSGKSGGQKEKLAYTILASALAFQFGLEWNVTKSRSFRFSVIDEAFSRGSDDSVKYGLELFKKLNLQLLLITPLQKIHVIENYINSIHVVSNNDEGSASNLRKITIEEHRKKREQSKLDK